MDAGGRHFQLHDRVVEVEGVRWSRDHGTEGNVQTEDGHEEDGARRRDREE